MPGGGGRGAIVECECHDRGGDQERLLGRARAGTAPTHLWRRTGERWRSGEAEERKDKGDEKENERLKYRVTRTSDARGSSCGCLERSGL